MNFLRFYNTIKDYKAEQIRQKFIYNLNKNYAQGGIQKNKKACPEQVQPLHYSEPFQISAVFSKGQFKLMNAEYKFRNNPDWNHSENGKLWNLRLNSFDFLHQQGMDADSGLGLLKHFVSQSKRIRSTYDSYCVSQRILNWLPFICAANSKDRQILAFVYNQARYLSANPEFHLRNNHLLDNAHALIRAGVYFRENKFVKRGTEILSAELPLQILSDGAHFELSPMYHCIQLRRILESIELLRNYEFAHHRDLICLMESKAGIMCGWLLQMAFDNGELPQVNDSSSDMPNWLGLFQYAERLGIKTRLQHLGPSGFRKFRNRNFELLVDVNGLNPALAPGHSHADTFSFILNVFGEPFIVDTGVSTYERGADRDYERSTLAHNTVIVAGKNQSEVYDSFRVGFKNKVFGLKENRNFVSASHDGYKSIGAIHSRSFEIKDREIIIRDIVDNVNSQSCIASFHVHKNSPLQQSGNGIIHKFVQISFEGADSVQLSDTKISPAFGVKVPAKKVLVGFSGELITRISLP